MCVCVCVWFVVVLLYFSIEDDDDGMMVYVPRMIQHLAVVLSRNGVVAVS